MKIYLNFLLEAAQSSAMLDGLAVREDIKTLQRIDKRMPKIKT